MNMKMTMISKTWTEYPFHMERVSMIKWNTNVFVQASIANYLITL